MTKRVHTQSAIGSPSRDRPPLRKSPFADARERSRDSRGSRHDNGAPRRASNGRRDAHAVDRPRTVTPTTIVSPADDGVGFAPLSLQGIPLSLLSLPQPRYRRAHRHLRRRRDCRQEHENTQARIVADRLEG